MTIGQYVQIFLTFLISMYINMHPCKCLSNNISKARVLIEPLLITQLIKLQFSDLSSAQKTWELICLDSACPK